MQKEGSIRYCMRENREKRALIPKSTVLGFGVGQVTIHLLRDWSNCRCGIPGGLHRNLNRGGGIHLGVYFRTVLGEGPRVVPCRPVREAFFNTAVVGEGWGWSWVGGREGGEGRGRGKSERKMRN